MPQKRQREWQGPATPSIGTTSTIDLLPAVMTLVLKLSPKIPASLLPASVSYIPERTYYIVKSVSYK